MPIPQSLKRTLTAGTGWGTLLVRLGLGTSMLYHGSQKLLPSPHAAHAGLLDGLKTFSGFVAGLGLPSWLGYVSVGAEFFGGLLLLLGLAVRPAAFVVAINMTVALVTVNLHRGLSASEYTLALIVMACSLVLSGSGRLGLDRALGLP